MLSEYRIQSILGIWGGLVFFAIGYLVASSSQIAYRYFGQTIMAGGYLLCVCGCFMYAKGKGHGWGWGFAGLLGPLGVLILYVLKDKSKMVLKERKKMES